MRTDLGLEDFTESLRALDAELDARGYQGELEIRALGGFALLAHGLRESGYTADIDTATPDLTPVERAAVLAVPRPSTCPQTGSTTTSSWATTGRRRGMTSTPST